MHDNDGERSQCGSMFCATGVRSGGILTVCRASSRRTTTIGGAIARPDGRICKDSSRNVELSAVAADASLAIGAPLTKGKAVAASTEAAAARPLCDS